MQFYIMKKKIDLIPCDIGLSGIEFSLGNAMSREFILKKLFKCSYR